MLRRLAEHGDIDYVIVHKVDRLARNRADDVQIQLTIERAKARLVSVTENVDDTPSGKLVRNIMADLAEYYSANLATEILKGSVQKARMGGTPHRAPVGYLNRREFVEGREIRFVVVDQERAPLVRRSFELYATGEYSTRQLHKLMLERGLTAPPTISRAAAPLSLSKFTKMLGNRYYIGVVTYRGVQYEGKHPPLVSVQTFETVQRLLGEREQHSLKQRIHRHYLRGLLTCRRCKARLQYTVVRGKTGDQFAYYVCGRRHRGDGCALPYLPAFEVEERMARNWPTWVRLDQLDAEEVGRLLHEMVVGEDQGRLDLVRQAEQRLARLDKERRKLLEMAYAEAIPLDLLTIEQDRIAREQEQASRQVGEAEQSAEVVEEAWQRARAAMQRGAEIYAVAGPEVRRQLNQAFLAVIEVDADEEEIILGEPWDQISRAVAHVQETSRTERQQPTAPRSTRRGRPSKANSEPDLQVRSSRMNPLVDLMVPYSNHLDRLKTVHSTLALAATDGVIADEPDLGAGVGVGP